MHCWDADSPLPTCAGRRGLVTDLSVVALGGVIGLCQGRVLLKPGVLPLLWLKSVSLSLRRLALFLSSSGADWVDC